MIAGGIIGTLFVLALIAAGVGVGVASSPNEQSLHADNANFATLSINVPIDVIYVDDRCIQLVFNGIIKRIILLDVRFLL